MSVIHFGPYVNTAKEICNICKRPLASHLHGYPFILDCGDIFHDGCLKLLLRSQHTCPDCGEEINSDEIASSKRTPDTRPIDVAGFFRAVRKNNLQRVIDAVDQRTFGVDVLDANGQTALLNAAFEGAVDVAVFLMSRGADVEKQGSDNLTPLMKACSKGHLDIVKALCEKNAVVDFVSDDGETALGLACANDHAPIVLYLLERGASVDLNDTKGTTHGVTPLMTAAEYGSEECLQILVDHNAGVNMQDTMEDSRQTALMIAATGDDVETSEHAVRILCSRPDVNVNLQSANGMTALMCVAQMYGSVESIKILLDKGAAVNLQDDTQSTALDYAFFAALDEDFDDAHVPVIAALLAKGASISENVNETENDKQFFIQIGDILSKNPGIKIDFLLSNGKTPFVWALSRGFMTMANFCLKAGANLNARFIDGMSALMLFAKQGDRPAVFFLWQNGANIDLKDARGWTALVHAHMANQQDIVRFLTEKGAKQMKDLLREGNS